MEIRKQEQRKLEEEQRELEKWRKKIQDRQREDEEFKVRKASPSRRWELKSDFESLRFVFLLLYRRRKGK